MLSRVWLFETPWTIAHQAPLSTEFSWQEYWSELPFPPPGDLPLLNMLTSNIYIIPISVYVCIVVVAVVQLLSQVWLFVTLWTAAGQAPLSSTISRS